MNDNKTFKTLDRITESGLIVFMAENGFKQSCIAELLGTSQPAVSMTLSSLNSEEMRAYKIVAITWLINMVLEGEKEYAPFDSFKKLVDLVLELEKKVIALEE